jgi:general stress protein YciG
VAKEDRGFASMDRAKQREIASKGGKAAHQKGTAHEWTSEEARDAGRKGGIASHQRRREAMTPSEGSSEGAHGPAGEETIPQNRDRGERVDSFEREDRTSEFAGNEPDGSER